MRREDVVKAVKTVDGKFSVNDVIRWSRMVYNDRFSRNDEGTVIGTWDVENKAEAYRIWKLFKLYVAIMNPIDENGNCWCNTDFFDDDDEYAKDAHFNVEEGEFDSEEYAIQWRFDFAENISDCICDYDNMVDGLYELKAYYDWNDSRNFWHFIDELGDLELEIEEPEFDLFENIA